MKVDQAIQGIERIANHIRADYALEIGNYTHVIASHIKMLEADNKRLRTRAYNRRNKNKKYEEAIKDAIYEYKIGGQDHDSGVMADVLVNVLEANK